MDLTQPSGLSLEQFKEVLTDSKDTNNVFANNAEYFYYAEQQYGINGIFLAAIGIHESAWGTSKISLNKKNLFGYGAYDSSPSSSAYSFSDYSEGIDMVARVLVKYYLNPAGTSIYNGETASGKYYSGNTISAVNSKYATDTNWKNCVYQYMKYLYNKI
jgi:beta-N-acetylglucosaminidase